VSFLHPALFAAGAAAVAIPIIIHLLMRRRRRPIEWAAMRFLLEAYRKHKRRLRLEQWLLLATRCLIIALLGAALARPFFGDANAGGSGPETVYLLIDNSLTASAESERDSALDRHKRLATDIVGTLDPSRGDRVGVVSLGGPAEPVVMPPSAELGALAQTIRSVESVDSAADLIGAISRVRDNLDSDNEQLGDVRIVVLSDFLEGSADVTRALEGLGDAGAELDVFASRPADASPDNVSVLTVEPLRPVVVAGRTLPGDDDGVSGSTQVRVGLRRTGAGVNDTGITTIRLGYERAGGADTLGEQTVRWSPGQTEASASVTADLRGIDRTSTRGVLTASIDRDTVAGDNTARAEIALRDTLRVSIVAPSRFGARPSIDRFENADWARLALSPLDQSRSLTGGADIELSDVSPDSVDAPHLGGTDAVVVATPHLIDRAAWRRLRTFADNGGLVVVIPPADEQAHLWPDAMNETFELGWSITTAPIVFDEPVPLTPGDGGALDLLGLLSAELGELIEPVSVDQLLAFDPSNGNASTLLACDGRGFVLASRPGGEGRGAIVVFTSAFDLQWTDLPAKPFMVPLMQELVRQGIGRARGTWSAVAGASPTTPDRAAVLTPLTTDGTGDIRVERDRTSTPVRNAGVWRALDARGATRGLLVVNADTGAGRTAAQPESDVGDWLGVINGRAPIWLDEQTPERGLVVAEAGLTDTDSPISLVLLALVATLALLEVALARWTSHAAATASIAEAPV
jgi:hypothetical protein